MTIIFDLITGRNKYNKALMFNLRKAFLNTYVSLCSQKTTGSTIFITIRSASAVRLLKEFDCEIKKMSMFCLQTKIIIDRNILRYDISTLTDVGQPTIKTNYFI
jgi:hypothetical protein